MMIWGELRIITIKTWFDVIYSNFVRWILKSGTLPTIGVWMCILISSKLFDNLPENILFGFIFAILFLIAIIVIVFVAFFLNNIWLNGIPRKYGDLLILLNEGFTRVHILRDWKKEDELSYEDVLVFALENFCGQLKVHFDNKSLSDCCVSIKVLNKFKDREIEENSHLFNVCRSQEHGHRDTEEYKKREHTISGNTGFNRITHLLANRTDNTENIDYIERNIPRKWRKKDYLNTSISKEEQENPNGEFPLEYKSEIIVPIIPYSYDVEDKPRCVGFLCVDSNRRYRVGMRYDTPLLRGVADGIYHAIMNSELDKKLNKAKS